MKKEYRAIDDFPGYLITNNGEVYHQKEKQIHQIKSRLDSKGNYILVTLINKDGKRKNCLVHRLVAKAFIPNPENLPEVNHKDKDKTNNNVNNLNWCTRRENLEDSYTTMSPNRNFKVCKLYKGGQLIGEFNGVRRAAKAASEQFGASFTSLSKYLKWLDIEIKMDDMTGKYMYNGHVQQYAQNRGPIYIISPDNQIITCNKWNDVVSFFQTLDIQYSETFYRVHICNKERTIKGYKITR